MESTMERGETKPALQSREIEQIPESGSTRTQSGPSPTTEMEVTYVENGDYALESDSDTSESESDASDSESDESENEIHFREGGLVYLKSRFRWFTRNFPFLFCWGVGAFILALPLVLSATKFRTTHIGSVRLFGFFFWLAISWCGLLFSYLFSWVLGYIWFVICQHNPLPDSDDYETFVVDIRHSTTLFFWAIISWVLVPLLCVLDHHHCTDHWVSTLHKVLLVTFLLALGFLVKSFFIERLFIKTAMETMNQRQRELEKSFYAIVVLLPLLDQHNSTLEWVKSIIAWVKAMRTWSTANSTAENILPTGVAPTEFEAAQYVADIFQGIGSKERYIALRLAIKNSPDLHQDSTTYGPRDGLYKGQVDSYLKRQLEKKKGHWQIWNNDFSLALRQFNAGDRLWPILLGSKFDKKHDTDFVSFQDLDWLIEYLGESLKEAVQGQKNIKSVVNSLDIRLTLFLCIPAAIVYSMCFSFYYPSFSIPLILT
jgi:hypothetical protein